MNEATKSHNWTRYLLVLSIAIPLLILLLIANSSLLVVGLWFWLAAVLAGTAVYLLAGSFRSPAPPLPPKLAAEPRMLVGEDQPQVIRDIMDIHIAFEQGGVKVFRGKLRVPGDAALSKLKEGLPSDVVPQLQGDEHQNAVIALMPKPAGQPAAARTSGTWINWALLGLTLITTTWTGALYQGVDLLQHPWHFTVGLPYALGLLAILGVHELGHYFMARHHGIDVTPPYFIPVPFGLGTFGAFIKMRSPAENRRALFDVAVAGPLAGLAVAIPALLIGLRTSTIVPMANLSLPYLSGGASVGSSILLALLSKLSLGNALQYGCVVRLSPLAFAGWLGLLVTALNLLPIGQLDGGHIATAMFGYRASRNISTLAMAALFFLAIFVWPTLLVWAIVVFFLAGRESPPLDDYTPLMPEQQWLGYAAFAILLLILLPLPHALWSNLGIHCIG